MNDSDTFGPPDGYDLLKGADVTLRPRHPDDVAELHAGLYDDVYTRAHADTRPWIPIPSGDPELSPYAVTSVSAEVSFFSVLATEGELAGEGLVWGIDAHNRAAQVGLALLPAFRGRGWSTQVLELLCRYAFVVRGLHRLQLEAHSANLPMIRSAKRAGFAEEGALREAAWTLGAFADVVVMGLLARDWLDAA